MPKREERCNQTTLMKFSIVTPSFKQLDHLKRCVASVADQAGSFELEHLIHDGGSGAEFEKWSSSQDSASVVMEKDKGMYDAINRGFLRSSGDILAWLNCDEQYLPGTLNKVTRYFEANPETDILFGDIVVVSSDGSPISYRQAIKPLPGHIRACFLSTYSAATFVRRKIIDTGYFLDISYRAISDAIWIDSLLRNNYRCQVLNEPLAIFTQTGFNLGQTAVSTEERNRWRKSTGYHGTLRELYWSTLHRSRKAIAGAYRTRGTKVEIYHDCESFRRERQAVISEKWVGENQQQSENA
jgi:glycosyltransferase involved in cell wall biosynthesis